MENIIKFTRGKTYEYVLMTDEESEAARHGRDYLLTGQTVFDGIDESLKMEYNLQQWDRMRKNIDAVSKMLDDERRSKSINESIVRGAELLSLRNKC